MHDNITKTYKHGSEDTISQIDDEQKDISKKLDIGNRIEQIKKRKALISLKLKTIREQSLLMPGGGLEDISKLVVDFTWPLILSKYFS
jgi:hypothetical protein